MLNKSVILVLLSCAIAFANPIQENKNPASQLETDVNIGLWLEDVHVTLRETFKQIVKPFAKTYSTLIEASKNVEDASKDKIEQLRIMFHQINDVSRDSLSDIENIVLIDTIINLQKAVESLNKIYSETNILSRQHVANQGIQNLQGIINNQANNVKDKFSQLQNSAWSGINAAGESINKMEHKLIVMFNGHIKNINENLNNGMKLRSGFFSKFFDGVKESANKAKNAINDYFHKKKVNEVTENANENVGQLAHDSETMVQMAEGIPQKINDKVQDAVNNGMNTISDGVENAKENLNQLGNDLATGLKIGEGISNKFSDKAQEIFDNDVNTISHGITNQFDEFISSTSNLREQQKSTGGIYDSRQILKNIKELLAQGVILQMNEIQQNLQDWKNTVDHFLANDNRSMKKQAQVIYDELINVPGSTGYMPDIDEELSSPNNPPTSNGQSVNDLFNSPGSIGYMPDIDDSIYFPDNLPTDDGKFTKLGQKIGGNIGGRVDKVVNTIGGIFNNAGKLIG